MEDALDLEIERMENEGGFVPIQTETQYMPKPSTLTQVEFDVYMRESYKPIPDVEAETLYA